MLCDIREVYRCNNCRLSFHIASHLLLSLITNRAFRTWFHLLPWDQPKTTFHYIEHAITTRESL